MRYENGKTDYEEDSDEETPERWVAHPGDIQHILSLQEELERTKERAREEHASEWEVTPSTDNDGSDNSLSDTYHMDAEEVTTMTIPTSLRTPPFGGTPGENLSSFFRRFDRAVRWVVHPRYSAGEEGRRQKEMDMALMIQDNLIGKALEESDTFPEAAYESAGFQGRSETGVPTIGNGGVKAKALSFYETLSIIDPETGDRDPPRAIRPASEMVPTVPPRHSTSSSCTPVPHRPT